MALYESAKAVNVIAGEDLRGDLYEVLQIENDGGVGKAIKATAVGDTIVGVLGEDPNSGITTDGLAVPVVLLKGVIKVKSGGTVTAGGLVIVDTGTPGRVVTVADAASLAEDSMAIGIALETVADGEIFSMLAMPIAVPHLA